MKLMRRRSWLLILALSWILAACTTQSSMTPTPDGGLEPVAVAPSATAPVEQATARATATEDVPPTPTTTMEATSTATSVPPTPTASIPPTVSPGGDLSLSSDGVFLHPVPDIYAGDPVTFYILADVPVGIDPNDVTVRVEVRDQLTMQGALNGRNLAGDAIGLFAWAWQTESQVGQHEMVITLDPDDTIAVGDEDPNNNQVVLTVPVLPESDRPFREQGQAWEVSETDCCILRVISGTAAHRDLALLRNTMEDAVAQATEHLGVQPAEKLDVYFIDRVIGQGGYAGSTMVISYLDRNYAGGGLHEVLVHEATHLLDRQFAPDRIAFLAEGLAVWAAGGHYKQEDIDQRVKALLETNRYLPLPDIIDNFYESQHEVAYAQAAGFINYLVTRYGWESTRAFYSDVHPQSASSYAAAVDEGLQRHFNLTLVEMEQAWIANLNAVPRDGQAVGDLLTTARYYDLMRDYQLNYDPTAHFLQAWLPYPQELEQRGLTADVTRHPEGHINVTLEVMLHAVDQAIAAGDLNRANVILDSVERALVNNGGFIDPLGQNYSQIVSKLTGLGFEVHQVDLSGNQARVQVTEGRGVVLRPITMALRNRDWVLLN